MPVSQTTQRHYGKAFVEFDGAEAVAANAVLIFDRMSLYGKSIRVHQQEQVREYCYEVCVRPLTAEATALAGLCGDHVVRGALICFLNYEDAVGFVSRANGRTLGGRVTVAQMRR